MTCRSKIAHRIIQMGDLIKDTAIGVMRPDDLVAFSRAYYAEPSNIYGWSRDEVIEKGLGEAEQNLLQSLPNQTYTTLLLGIGGGREALALAKAGHHVTGVDFVHGMVSEALINAEKHQVRLLAAVQDIAHLGFDPASFNLIWLSSFMYSCIPTRHRRVAMLKRIYLILDDQGYFVCQFSVDQSPLSQRRELFKRLVTIISLGHMHYEPGDKLIHYKEFVHDFRSKEEVLNEFERTGFEVVQLKFNVHNRRGAAILKK